MSKPTYICPDCAGTGKNPFPHTYHGRLVHGPCFICDGTGQVEELPDLDVRWLFRPHRPGMWECAKEGRIQDCYVSKDLHWVRFPFAMIPLAALYADGCLFRPAGERA
jgi:hypothetical protein